METKNIYSKPIDEEYIQKVLTTEAPAHKLYVDENTGRKVDLKNAIDFLCGVKTPVKATLDGKIIFIKDGVTKHWNKFEEPPKDLMSEDEQDGNYLLIEHANHELSWYSHLEAGINFNKGDEVKEGEILGYVGNNGWSIKPHLHFVVGKEEGTEKYFKSLKPRWKK